MIASLRGTVLSVGLTNAVIETGGVGMSIQATPTTLSGLRVGEETLVHTEMVVREDSLTLFGFADTDERDSFRTLMSAKGVGATLALALAHTGKAFSFFSPFLGWVGVFLTGSDTSANALFGALQATTAQQLGLPEVLTVAANTTGGVTGKMISPQSIAIATAAVGLAGRESDLFRFTVRHSLMFAAVIGVLTTLQAHVLTWTLPGN